MTVRRGLRDVLPTSASDAKPMQAITSKQPNEDGEEVTIVVETGLLEDLVATGVKASRSTVKAELDRWVADGYVGKRGTGHRGDPTRYWLIATPPEMDSADASIPKYAQTTSIVTTSPASNGANTGRNPQMDSVDGERASAEWMIGATSSATDTPLCTDCGSPLATGREYRCEDYQVAGLQSSRMEGVR
jgi:hypothetical protein